MAGAVLSIGLAFSAIFDPPQSASIEQIKKTEEKEEDAASDGGGAKR